MKNLNDLREIQRSIQSAVRSQLEVQKISDILLEKPPISIFQRLKIYQDGYEARLEESLNDDFERVQAKLNSPDQFEKVIQDFIHQCPSTVRNIAEYSEDFPAFLKNQYPDLFESALCDWFSLVAAKIPDVPLSAILRAEEIQEGVPFQLRVYLSTLPFRSDDKYYITVKSNKDVGIQEVSLEEYELVRFLSKSQSIDDFVEKAQSLKIEDATIAKKINEWIRQQVIYCERI
jgi:hypothetical protein